MNLIQRPKPIQLPNHLGCKSCQSMGQVVAFAMAGDDAPPEHKDGVMVRCVWCGIISTMSPLQVCEALLGGMPTGVDTKDQLDRRMESMS